MNCLKRNKQKLYYSLLVGEQIQYELDRDGNKIIDWVDGDITYYKETGIKEPLYSEPVLFMGNIAFSGGDVERTEFGVDQARYEAILVLNRGEIPITETSLLWYQTEPETKEIEGHVYADDSTADYKILKIVPSLNNDRYILAKVVK